MFLYLFETVIEESEIVLLRIPFFYAVHVVGGFPLQYVVHKVCKIDHCRVTGNIKPLFPVPFRHISLHIIAPDYDRGNIRNIESFFEKGSKDRVD